VFDDSNNEKIFELYDNRTTEKRLIECPDYIEIEPLKLECQHFISCIQKRTKPRSDGLNGYETVKILEEAEKMMLGSQYGKISNIKLASSRKKQRT
jgi:predicted dehydrogenase